MNVSIIIPAFNAAETIAETLDSVLAQTCSDWEAVVVDDGSTDGTAEIATDFAARDSRIRVLKKTNGGEGSARNAGILVAQHEWLLFLDADDWIAPVHLERLTRELVSRPELDAVHCGYARVARDGTLVIEQYQPPAGDLFSTLARRAAFPVHCCIVRKTIVERVGSFDTTLQKSPDWDLWQRVARTGARFGAVREVLAFYRMRPNAASLDARQLLKDGLRVLKQGHAPDPRVPDPHPDHAGGMPPEQVKTQSFYLLAWCAALLLGSGEDARSLLESLEGQTYSELSPEAVAQCIFEAALLPTCQSPTAWEELWPRIQQSVIAFLVALEEQSMAPDLARLAQLRLEGAILKHSPTWSAVIEEYERTIATQQESLERARSESQKLFERLESAQARHEPDTSAQSAWRSDWTLRVAGGNRADLAFPSDNPQTVRVEIHRARGRHRWNIQLNQRSPEVKLNQRYSIHFRARADRPRSMALGFAMAHEPWTGLGFYETIELCPEWKSFSEELIARADESDARIHFDLGHSNIAVEISDVKLGSSDFASRGRPPA